jgi:NADPH:quinone reductase-like Zn-dependent oxidoreductase
VLRRTKAQAEYLVVGLNSIDPAPEGMDPTLAATIPLNAMTASQALDHLPLRSRDDGTGKPRANLRDGEGA